MRNGRGYSRNDACPSRDMLLSIEMAEFYGVKDAALCSDFVTYVNGMMGFAEANRRECWGQMCLGMLNTQAKLKSYAELDAKYDAALAKATQWGDQYRKSEALCERLNAANKEYLVQIESLKSQLQPGVRTPSVVAPNPQQLQVERSRSRTGPSAKRSIAEAVPESDDDEQPAPKKDKSDVVVELKKKLAYLVADNERLDKLLRAHSRVEVPSSEPAKVRLKPEDIERMRKAFLEVEAKLRAVTEEARQQAHRFAEQTNKNEEALALERTEWARRLEAAGDKDASSSILIPSAFSLQCGNIMTCPVPIRTGRLVPLVDIYQSWIRYPSDSEGTFFASFLCPYSTQLTSLGSAEEVDLIYNIASELRLFTTPPLRFQHFLNGSWVDFSFIDQITIAASCCKHYRLGTTRVVENVMVCQGDFIFKIHISDAVVDFQMQPVHNLAKTSPACLLEGMPGFFQRWSFPTGSDEVRRQ